MEDRLIRLLESLGYPVYRQGSFASDEEYPDHFFTFWNHASNDHAYYDNQDYGTNWSYSVYFYSIDPELAYDAVMEARAKLKESGWIVPSKGFDVQSDDAGHTGRGLEIFYLETEQAETETGKGTAEETDTEAETEVSGETEAETETGTND